MGFVSASRYPTNIDRRLCRRVVPMRVLVLGLSRTGTDSIRKALLMLGYVDTYHGYSAAIENPRDCEMWLDAMAAKWDGIGKPFGRAEFDQLLGHCQAVCDIPAAVFAKELIEAYPEAKVILSNREATEWHHSVKTALLRNVFTPWAAFVDTLAVITQSPNRWTRTMFIRAFEGYFGKDFENNGIKVFHEHYAMVRDMVPGENLLEYTVQQGWQPLCKFLECGVPAQEFPNGNDREETERRIRTIVNGEVIRLTRLLVAVISMCLAAWALLSSVSRGHHMCRVAAILPSNGYGGMIASIDID